MAGESATKTERIRLNADAATVDTQQTMVEAPFDGYVTGADFIPDASVTGNTTDTRTLTLYNRGQAGAGTTSVATLALITATDLVAYDKKAFALNGTAANLAVTKGDVLEVQSAHGGSSGLANPGGEVLIHFSTSKAEIGLDRS